MKELICKNCGAAYPEDTEYCPYCGTMNKKGAYKGFRKRVSGMIDRMLGLKQEAHQSVSRTILSALIRSFVIVAVIVLAAYLCALRVNVNYHNNYEYDSKALADIEWYEANIDKLEEYYHNDDLKAIKKLYYENISVVSKWSHYPDYVLADEYEQMITQQRFSKYQLQKMLYYLFWPEFYTGRDRMKGADTARYQTQRQQILDILESHGFDEEQLKTIYQQHSDKQGYIDTDALEGYVKED
ncbi:MAG: zinc-ribbon domain-containing protein [Erysipelotrichaceae bacterium]|nr:zinc-ribbon domain-containing protein [Erysipelotrichaceae bacterium]MBR5049282.1 zinc-ribbon domain-containing protein [Erysipelotrichaceae bacterium]